MLIKKFPLLFFFITLVAIGIAALFGPEEKALGANVRYVYIHGAWVLAAQAALVLAGVTGFLALLARFLPSLAEREGRLHRWSAALGRSGILFWVTYLPLSLLAMQANWNGLFLAEPRFRLALTFAIVGVLLQIGLWLMNTPWLTSLANLIFIIVLRYVFSNAAYVMHPPPSPIFNSGLTGVISFFVALNILVLLAAFFLTRWFLSLEKR